MFSSKGLFFVIINIFFLENKLPFRETSPTHYLPFFKENTLKRTLGKNINTISHDELINKNDSKNFSWTKNDVFNDVFWS